MIDDLWSSEYEVGNPWIYIYMHYIFVCMYVYIWLYMYILVEILTITNWGITIPLWWEIKPPFNHGSCVISHCKGHCKKSVSAILPWWDAKKEWTFSGTLCSSDSSKTSRSSSVSMRCSFSAKANLFMTCFGTKPPQWRPQTITNVQENLHVARARKLGATKRQEEWQPWTCCKSRGNAFPFQELSETGNFILEILQGPLFSTRYLMVYSIFCFGGTHYYWTSENMNNKNHESVREKDRLIGKERDILTQSWDMTN